MANDSFVDTSGFFAAMVRQDGKHASALRVLREAKRRGRGFITTDYVIDETATVLKARHFRHLIQAFFETLEASNACRVQWTESERFQQVQRFYVKHSDQDWSFTDCLSFCVMTELRLREALTTAVHFVQAGFKALLK